jgi:hypothetical protein
MVALLFCDQRARRMRVGWASSSRSIRARVCSHRMSTCAYCKSEGKVTKEEVMPLSLSRNRPMYRTVLDHDRGIVRRGLVTAVRDVCEECNGVKLSSLDNYASRLDREYFMKIADFRRAVNFRYDFDLLLRWLLKIIYNDDRTRPPPYAAERFVPYILGQDSRPPLRTTLLLGFISASETTEQQRAEGLPEMLEPESCGVGYLYVNRPAGPDIELSRFVEINSYFFQVIAWKDSVARPVSRHHLAKICELHRFHELKAKNESVIFKKPSMDFLKFQTDYAIRRPMIDRR